jgi:hypothetical protein
MTSEESYEIFAAPTALQALNWEASVYADLILTDLGSPGIYDDEVDLVMSCPRCQHPIPKDFYCIECGHVPPRTDQAKKH